MKPSRSLVGGRALFVALALADLLTTSCLLGAAPEQFYESNPVARWCLSHGGWAGLAGLKVVTVLLALAAVAAVARRRPRAAGRVLRFACGATALVVVYSCGLAFAARALPNLKALTEQGRRIDEQLRAAHQYCRVMDRLTKDLCSVPCAVGEAVACFAATNHTGSRAWSATLRDQYPGKSDAERMAALLLDRPVQQPCPRKAGPRMGRRLRARRVHFRQRRRCRPWPCGPGGQGLVGHGHGARVGCPCPGARPGSLRRPGGVVPEQAAQPLPAGYRASSSGERDAGSGPCRG
jgi:hypothetical protein